MPKSRTALADAVLAIAGSRRTTNERGNVVTTAFVGSISRDTFDSRIYRGGKGWQQKYFSPRLTAASLCLSLMVGLAGGCRSTVPTRNPEPAEITEITCGRSCLVSSAGPSTVVWVD